MKITKEEDKRLNESRNILLKAMLISLGSYIEQEAKKKDNWREKSFGEMRSKTKTQQLHNAMDACSLSAMLVAKLIQGE